MLTFNNLNSLKNFDRLPQQFIDVDKIPDFSWTVPLDYTCSGFIFTINEILNNMTHLKIYLPENKRSISTNDLDLHKDTLFSNSWDDNGKYQPVSKQIKPTLVEYTLEPIYNFIPDQSITNPENIIECSKIILII